MVDRYPTPRTNPAQGGGGLSWPPSGSDKNMMDASDNKRAMANARGEFPRLGEPARREGPSPVPPIPLGKLPGPLRKLPKLGPAGLAIQIGLDIYDWMHEEQQVSPFMNAHHGFTRNCGPSYGPDMLWKAPALAPPCSAISGVPSQWTFKGGDSSVPSYNGGVTNNIICWLNSRYQRNAGYIGPASPYIKASPTDDPTMMDLPKIDMTPFPDPAAAPMPDPNPDPVVIPSPAPSARPENAPHTATGIPGGGGGFWYPFVRYGVPGPATKEVKLTISGLHKIALGTFNSVSELRDFVRGVWKALDRKEKTLTDQMKIPSNKRLFRTGQQTLPIMMRDIYNAKSPWGAMGLDSQGRPTRSQKFWDDALTNVIENQVQDYIFGKIGKTGAKASRASRIHGSAPVGLLQGGTARQNWSFNQ